MDEKTIQFRVGVLVVATAIISVILVTLMGGIPTGFQSTKIVYVRFSSAPGITVDTPVRKSGILVGRVIDVELQDDASVMVTTRLEKHKSIFSHEICRIATGNILGDSMLEFVPTPGVQVGQPLENGALLEGEVAIDPMTAVGNALRQFDDLAFNLKGTLHSIENAGGEIRIVAKNLNTLVVNNQEQVNRILGKAENAMGKFETAMISVNQVADEELAEKLRTALDGLPELMRDAGTLIASLNDVADAAEKNLVNLQGLTQPLGEKGDQLVSSIDRSLDRLDLVLQDLQSFSKAINESEGSLSQFVHNPDLYQRLNNAAANIENLTYQLEPIVDNARVISDKLARNPGRMLRGAFGPQQSGLK